MRYTSHRIASRHLDIGIEILRVIVIAVVTMAAVAFIVSALLIGVHTGASMIMTFSATCSIVAV